MVQPECLAVGKYPVTAVPPEYAGALLIVICLPRIGQDQVGGGIRVEFGKARTPVVGLAL